MNMITEPVQFLENNKAPQTLIMSTSQQIQALKIPEAVVALAQAAGKVSGETEKYLPGWSLFPCTVQMLKCEKCSREFCSTINYRRHIRVHRRSLNIDKDSTKNRMLLGVFWDKLPLEEAKEISSFKNVDIEDVTGSSIIRALKTSVQNLGLPLLPHIYVKAGTTLLNVIEGSPSRFPISSQELFGVLDDASEETFLCAGSTLSMQKYIFSGDAGKIALETKNSVAFASFMLEQKLVKSWYADKDIEALKCQRVLMEEEEVAKKRQAELQERKRLKKLRKKEKRVNISTGVANAKNKKCLFDTVEATCSSIETLNEMPACEFCQNTSKEPVCQETQCGEATGLVEPQLDWNRRQHSHPDNADQTVDQKIKAKASECQITTTSGQVPMSAQNSPNGHDLREVPSAKSSVTSTNDLMILTSKTVLDREDANERNTDPKARYSYNEHEVLIGSISVTLRKGYDDSREASALVQKHFKKLAKNDLHPSSAIRTTIELHRPVRHDIADSTTEKIATEGNQFHSDAFNQISVEDIYLSSVAMVDSDTDKCWNSFTDLGDAGLSLPRMFSSQIARAFLAERWKESMIADHVTLTLPSDLEATRLSSEFEVQDQRL